MTIIWKQPYCKLTEYIAAHSEIEIETNLICIPADLRPGFYKLFNQVCIDITTNTIGTNLRQAHILSNAWNRVSQEAKDQLNLESISLPDSTKWFLKDPVDGLTRGLVDPLFDLLKRRINLVDFEETASRLIVDEFNKSFKEGYKAWGCISVLNLLNPDKLYSVPVEDYYDPSMQDLNDIRPGDYKENVPKAVETKRISIIQDPIYTFLPPSFIVRSQPSGYFYGFRFGFREARWMARTVSPALEWLDIGTIKNDVGYKYLWPDLAIYRADHFKKLTLVADYYRVARPDIIIDFRESQGWSSNKGMDSIIGHCRALKPIIADFVVFREKEAETSHENDDLKSLILSYADRAEANPLELITMKVGYDSNLLKPIIVQLSRANQ